MRAVSTWNQASSRLPVGPKRRILWAARALVLRAPRDAADQHLARRCGEGAARGRVGMIARDPAAINQHGCVAAAEPQRGQDVDARRAIQLAIAQHDLLRWIIHAAHLDTPILQRVGVDRRARERERRLGHACVQRAVECAALRQPIQLPDAEPAQDERADDHKQRHPQPPAGKKVSYHDPPFVQNVTYCSRFIQIVGEVSRSLSCLVCCYSKSFLLPSAGALRGGRQGAAAPPAPPARDFVPWNPDSMHRYAERLARMLTGNVEPAATNACFGITEGMRRCIDRAASINCRGFGGVLRPQWGARGAKPARILAATQSATGTRRACREKRKTKTRYNNSTDLAEDGRQQAVGGMRRRVAAVGEDEGAGAEGRLGVAGPRQPWPMVAACWSPATPQIGMARAEQRRIGRADRPGAVDDRRAATPDRSRTGRTAPRPSRRRRAPSAWCGWRWWRRSHGPRRRSASRSASCRSSRTPADRPPRGPPGDWPSIHSIFDALK